MRYYTCASDQAIGRAASALAESRLVLIEGPVGSGRSFTAAAVARGWDMEAQGDGGGCRLFDTVCRIYGDPADAGTDFLAVEHLLGPDRDLDPWSRFSDRLAGSGQTLIVVDDVQFLDRHSLTLLEWALGLPDVRMLATVPSIDDSPAATALAAQAESARIVLGPVGPRAAHRMLAEWWRRDPHPWEVAFALRLSGGLPGMLAMFADFTTENGLSAADPATWERRLLERGTLSFGRLGEHIDRLRAVHDADTWTALTTIAVAGTLELDAAVGLLGAQALGRLRGTGLLRVDARSGAVALSSGILDIGLRGTLSTEAVAALWGEVLQPLMDGRGWLPPASQVAWLDAHGIAGIGTHRGPAAAAALRERLPEVALRLVGQARHSQGLLTTAEAHWHAGRPHDAAAAVDEALLSASDQLPDAREVAAAVLTGRYCAHAARLGTLPGAGPLFRAAAAAGSGDHAAVVRLAGSMPAEAPEELRLLATSLAAMSHAKLGDLGAAVRAVRSLPGRSFTGASDTIPGSGADRCSTMTERLMDDARRCVALLSGDWRPLTADLDATAQTAGQGWDGTGDVLAVLLGHPEADVPGSGWAGTAPAVLRELRHLAIAVRKYDGDPSAALDRVRWFRARSAAVGSTDGVDVLAAAWELKLCAACGTRPDPRGLFSVSGPTTHDAGVLPRILGMVAAALDGGEEVSPALNSATALAKRYGLDRWLPPLRSFEPQALQRPRHALSLREHQICRLAADGRTSLEIAGELGISVRTVEKHLGNAYRKLGVSARKQLAELGAGLTEPGNGEFP